MKSAREPSRKRSRSSITATAGSSSSLPSSVNNNNNNNNNNKSSRAASTPPVICLTGFSQEEKEYYHGLIQKLGGSFTRTLDASVNTHLMAKKPEGAKYEAAVDFAASLENDDKSHTNNPPRTFHIVRTTWLRDCVQQKQFIAVQPEVHGYSSKIKGDDDDDGDPTIDNQESQEQGDAVEDISQEENRNQSTTTRNQERDDDPQLLEQLKRALEEDADAHTGSTLFSPCHFIFIGLDAGAEDYVQLTRLVRRGHGRIAWTFNDNITHVVLPDATCDETVREAAKTMQTEHPNAPSVVAPTWILACWEKKELLEPSSRRFGPSFVPKESLTAVSRKPKKPKIVTNKSTLFRGCFFAFLRVAPPDWAVDYDSKELENLILSYSGQMLTSRIVEALMIDNTASGQRANNKYRYKCYTVCWGGSGFDQSLNMHPTLGQIQRGDLCEIIQVTPNWLQTCCSQDKLISRSKCPTFFRPVSWPVRRLLLPTATTKESKLEPDCRGNKQQQQQVKSIHVALSGIRGSLRSAIIHWIRALGASYDESMERNKTTHLICQQANELKHDKAKEWGIHVVSVDWIYHVSQYGLPGKNGTTGGCESQFPVARRARRSSI